MRRRAGSWRIFIHSIFSCCLPGRGILLNWTWKSKIWDGSNFCKRFWTGMWLTKRRRQNIGDFTKNVEDNRDGRGNMPRMDTQSHSENKKSDFLTSRTAQRKTWGWKAPSDFYWTALYPDHRVCFETHLEHDTWRVVGEIAERPWKSIVENHAMRNRVTSLSKQIKICICIHTRLMEWLKLSLCLQAFLPSNNCNLGARAADLANMQELPVPSMTSICTGARGQYPKGRAVQTFI